MEAGKRGRPRIKTISGKDGTKMDQLKERIRREGKVLPGNIIKVDGFLNHRVDVKLMEDIALEFEK